MPLVDFLSEEEIKAQQVVFDEHLHVDGESKYDGFL